MKCSSGCWNDDCPYAAPSPDTLGDLRAISDSIDSATDDPALRAKALKYIASELIAPMSDGEFEALVTAMRKASGHTLLEESAADALPAPRGSQRRDTVRKRRTPPAKN